MNFPKFNLERLIERAKEHFAEFDGWVNPLTQLLYHVKNHRSIVSAVFSKFITNIINCLASVDKKLWIKEKELSCLGDRI